MFFKMLCTANIILSVVILIIVSGDNQINDLKTDGVPKLSLKHATKTGDGKVGPQEPQSQRQALEDEQVELKRLKLILETPNTESTIKWPVGIIPYYINTTVIDDVTIDRITKAMEHIQSLSCVEFTKIKDSSNAKGAWLHITNIDNERECVHSTPDDSGAIQEIMVVIGIDCIRPEEILHTLLHGIGLHDEVTHPHRDQYIRVLWENIQPKYRPLYGIRHSDPPRKLVEYDPVSVMHFHDRAFSANGGATIASLLPGLSISPSRTLSQLDILKLQLAFGHACKKRQVSGLFDTCKDALPNDPHSEEDSAIDFSSHSEQESKRKSPVERSSNEDTEQSDSQNIADHDDMANDGSQKDTVMS